MAIIKWSPVRDLDRLFADDFPTVSFTRLGGNLAVDVYEKDKNVIAEMHLAGMDPDSLDVTVEDNMLHISGKKEDVREEDKKDYYYKEIERGEFERTVRLPVKVKEASAKAVYEDGILTVTIPKAEETKKNVKVEIKK